MEASMVMGKSLDKPAFEMMELLNSELGRYERIIEMTATLLSPVLLEVEVDDRAVPIEAPSTDLHRAIQRLDHLNSSLERLRSRIRL